MQRFVRLYAELDASTATGAKVAALRRYLVDAPPDDAAWAVYLLAGGRPRRAVGTAVLRAAALAASGLPEWLFEESYQAVGDLAETIAQVLPAPAEVQQVGLAAWMGDRLAPLRGEPPEAQQARLQAWWAALDAEGRFLLVKLIGGGFRVGVSRLLVQRALAEHAGLPPALVAQRMMGFTDAKRPPDAQRLAALLAPEGADVREAGQPYPFFLAHALERAPDELGPRADWQAEWKYDGIRAQLVRRAGGAWLWSRGEELISERFPEVMALAQGLPEGTVLDGELLVWPAGEERPAGFQRLQTRINRQQPSRALLAQHPVVFVAYDGLEIGGADQRERPLRERRAALQALLAAHPGLRLSPEVDGRDWPDLTAARAGSRERGVEGLMLKHRGSVYGSGRTRGTGGDGGWWKWKIEPYTVDAVLIYAQAGHGRRASLYTDYTFAVWNRPPADADEARAVVEAITRREPAQPGALQLVSFAKAYSGLSDAEFKAVDRVIRATTLEKFGPVRSVRPTLVFELGFEGLQRSARHKSGVAVRFPRMLRVRDDKPLHEADSLASLLALVDG